MRTRRFAIVAGMILLVFSFAGASRAGSQRAAWPSAAFGPPPPTPADAVGGSVRIRRRPSPRAPLVTTLSVQGAASDLTITGLSGPFVHVRKGRIEGWASEREAMPVTVAFVVDARSGRTVARVPVGRGQHEVAFSPDGSRAVVYGFVADGPRAAFEFRASDFKPTRAVTARGMRDEPSEVLAVFYAADGALYAAIEDDFAPDDRELAVVPVAEPGAAARPPVWTGSGREFVVAPAGRLGFVLRSAEYDGDLRPKRATIDVFDLDRLAVRNTITLDGDLAASFDALVPSADGSELFLLGDVSRLRVVDTTTGAVVREIATGWPPHPEMVLTNFCSGGRSLLLVANGNRCEIDVPDGAWWISGARATRAESVGCSVDTGTVRYSVEGEGTTIVAAGAGGKTRRVARLRQPDLGAIDWTISSLELRVNPDGSRIVLFASYFEIFCPC